METSPISLLGMFIERHQELRRRLKRRLGSDDVVNDVLQETYLRVERMSDASASGVTRNPAGYLFRIALNVAADQRQADARFLTGVEIDDLLHIADESLDPARIVHARLEIAALERALEELTPRQRDILMAARVENTPQQDIAQHFGISVRMVGKELKKALEHCGERLDRRVVQRFGPGAGNES